MLSEILRASCIVYVMAVTCHAGIVLPEDDPADQPAAPGPATVTDSPIEFPQSLTCPDCPGDSVLCSSAVCEAYPELHSSCRNNCDKCAAEFFFPRDSEKRTVNCDMGACEAGCNPYMANPCEGGEATECASDTDCQAGYTCCKTCCGTACRKMDGPGPDSVHPGTCPEVTTGNDSAVSCTVDTECRSYQKCCGQAGKRTCQEAIVNFPVLLRAASVENQGPSLRVNLPCKVLIVGLSGVVAYIAGGRVP